MFQGPSQAVYPALLTGTDSERTKLKLCPRCFSRYADEVLSQLHLVALDDESINFPPACFRCGRQALDGESLFPVFCTWYPRGLERQDAFGQLCQAHVASWASNLLEPRYTAAHMA